MKKAGKAIDVEQNNKITIENLKKEKYKLVPLPNSAN
jgi:hypothetical protein